MKKLLSVITSMLLILSMMPAVAPHGIVLDQGDKTAALIGEVFANVNEEIYVQYLGNENARLHFIFYNDDCTDNEDYVEEVTPLEIVKLNSFPPNPIPNGDRKLVVVVEDLDTPRHLINEPLAGVIFMGVGPTADSRRAVKNLPALTAVTSQLGDIIREIPSTGKAEIRADGTDYNLLPMNFIHLPFLTTPTAPTLYNSLAINDFDGTNTQAIDSNRYNDDEKVSSGDLAVVDCAGLTNLDIAGFRYADIGGVGIEQGVPPGLATDAGVGAIKSKRTTGRLLVESTFSDEVNGPPQGLSNVFLFGNGESTTLKYEPLGIFTGKNENYQNPELGNALASLGIQKAVLDNDGYIYNVETIFAIYDNEDRKAAKTYRARFDYVIDDPLDSECYHQDFDLVLTGHDVEYVRVSDITGLHLDPTGPDGGNPIYGVLTVWDPTGNKNLAGYRWDVVIQDTDPQPPMIISVLDQEVMLTLDASYANNVATFEAAEHATTIVPTMPPGVLTPNFNLIYVNWDALDDPTALSQELAFQVTDDAENVKSLKIPTTECITVLDRQSFAQLSDGIAFGGTPKAISYTGRFSQPNRGLAAFIYYNDAGIDTEETMSVLQTLTFTNNHHDGEIFTDINIKPGSLPGPGGTYNVQVGITPSVNLGPPDETVTAGWYAAIPGTDLDSKVSGPPICQEDVAITTPAGKAFAIVIDGCLIDPLSIDAFLRVQSASLGDVELFVPATT